jgi:hypothetical protein
VPTGQRQPVRGGYLFDYSGDTHSLRWGDGPIFRDTILMAGKFQSEMECRNPRESGEQGLPECNL